MMAKYNTAFFISSRDVDDLEVSDCGMPDLMGDGGVSRNLTEFSENLPGCRHSDSGKMN